MTDILLLLPRFKLFPSIFGIGKYPRNFPVHCQVFHSCVTPTVVSWAIIERGNMCLTLCLGHQEFWESVDPSASTLSSRRRGHEDLPHLVWVSSPAGFQELHPPHYPPGDGHPAARRQPQQSIGYHTRMHTLEVFFFFFKHLSSHLKLISGSSGNRTSCYVTPCCTMWCHGRITLHRVRQHPHLCPCSCRLALLSQGIIFEIKKIII